MNERWWIDGGKMVERWWIDGGKMVERMDDRWIGKVMVDRDVEWSMR